MNKLFTLALCLLTMAGTQAATAQTTPSGNDSLMLSILDGVSQPARDSAHKTLVFSKIEGMPEPRYDLQQYINDNIRYPKQARKNHIEGKVIIKYSINDDGKVDECTVVKSADSLLDAEALRVIRNMPRWKRVHRKEGAAKKSFFYQPFTFRL